MYDIINQQPFDDESVYVLGHRNPDNDAICSAIGMACYKNMESNSEHFRPCIIDSINPQSHYILETYYTKTTSPYSQKPSIISDLYFRVKDAMVTDFSPLDADMFLKESLEFLSTTQSTSAPVLNGDTFLGNFSIAGKNNINFLNFNVEHLVGLLISVDDIINRFKKNLLTPVKQLNVDAGTQIFVDSANSHNIPRSCNVVISAGNDNHLAEIVEQLQPAVLIVCQRNAPPSSAVIKQANRHQTGIIDVPYTIFTVCNLLSGTVRISNFVDKDCEVLYEMDLLQDKIDVITEAHHPLPVLNNQRELVGIISSKNLLSPTRKHVILTDHSEISQSVPGLQDCNIKEVVDHHRLGDIQTLYPIEIMASPVGACSTLVAAKFRKSNLMPPTEVAALLLSAILTDTLLFNSPTTTKTDIEIADWLSNICGLDINEFGMEILKKNDFLNRYVNQSESIKNLIDHDFKEFWHNDIRFGISQIETVNAKHLNEIQPEIYDALEEKRKQGYLFCLFVVTDLLKNQSYIFMSHDTNWLKDVFGNDSEPYLTLKNVMSRKLQIVPPILNYLHLTQRKTG